MSNGEDDQDEDNFGSGSSSRAVGWRLPHRIVRSNSKPPGQDTDAIGAATQVARSFSPPPETTLPPKKPLPLVPGLTIAAKPFPLNNAPTELLPYFEDAAPSDPRVNDLQKKAGCTSFIEAFYTPKATLYNLLSRTDFVILATATGLGPSRTASYMMVQNLKVDKVLWAKGAVEAPVEWGFETLGRLAEDGSLTGCSRNEPFLDPGHSYVIHLSLVHGTWFLSGESCGIATVEEGCLENLISDGPIREETVDDYVSFLVSLTDVPDSLEGRRQLVVEESPFPSTTAVTPFS